MLQEQKENAQCGARTRDLEIADFYTDNLKVSRSSN